MRYDDRDQDDERGIFSRAAYFLQKSISTAEAFILKP